MNYIMYKSTQIKIITHIIKIQIKMGNLSDQCCNQNQQNHQSILPTDITMHKTMQQILLENMLNNTFDIVQSPKSQIKQTMFLPLSQQYHNGEKLRQANIQIFYQSPKKINNQINLDYIYKDNSSQKTIYDDLMAVPFQIIRLTVSQKLEKQIRNLGPGHLNQYSDENAQINKRWKLHQNGCYINILSLGNKSVIHQKNIQSNIIIKLDQIKLQIQNSKQMQKQFLTNQMLVAIITQHKYYQGTIVEHYGKLLVPDGNGILYNEDGVYKGMFLKGRAHGQGSFRNGDTDTLYKGRWQNGQMIIGTIQNLQFKFSGSFENGFATKIGHIKFKKSGATYQGTFEQGQYDSEKAIYKGYNFQYNGGFKNSKRNGKGYLKEIGQITKPNDKKYKYRPPQEFYGNWNNDILEIRANYSN